MQIMWYSILETTGFSPETNSIIEIGAVKVQNGKIVDKFSTFVNPQVPIPFRIEQLTSINDSMVIDAPVIADILPEFLEFCEGCVMVAHNADFDMSFIKKTARGWIFHASRRLWIRLPWRVSCFRI